MTLDDLEDTQGIYPISGIGVYCDSRCGQTDQSFNGVLDHPSDPDGCG